MTTQFQWYPSFRIPSAIGFVLFRVIFFLPNLGVPDAKMSIIWSEPHEPISNLSVTTCGSEGDIFRTLPVSSLMGCPCSFTDRKRIPMPSVIDIVCHRPGFWINVGNIRWIKSTSLKFFFLSVLFYGLLIFCLEWWYSPWQSWSTGKF